MSRKEELIAQKEWLNDEIGFLFYTDDTEDGLRLIRQAISEIEEYGHIQNTADEYIDPYRWSEAFYKELMQTLKTAEAVYSELLALENQNEDTYETENN